MRPKHARSGLPGSNPQPKADQRGDARLWVALFLLLAATGGLLLWMKTPEVLEDLPALKGKIAELREQVASKLGKSPEEDRQIAKEPGEGESEGVLPGDVPDRSLDPAELMHLYDPADQVPDANGEFLPSLNDSDQPFRNGLTELDLGESLDSWLIDEELVRKFVVLVDNIAVGRLPRKHSILASPAEPFTAVELNDHYRLDPGSYRRYNPYSEVFLAIDTEQAIKVYRHFYPLMQQAYAELGFPRRSFHRRFLQALDLLIASPVVAGPIDLVRPAVMYKFADPRLEALPAAQKQLIRMGPENMRRVQARLREYRQLLSRLTHNNG